MDFDNLTIVRYLMNWNDDSTTYHENFINSEKQFGKECGYCDRICDYA
jgi:nuclear transport factor 2 (NTF2) superfamily protein